MVNPPVVAKATKPGEAAVDGQSDLYNGVVGTTTARTAYGVAGVNDSGGDGTYGRGVSGVIGHGIDSGGAGAGVTGYSDKAVGVLGRSTENNGVSGQGRTGGWFEGAFEGVHAVSHNPSAAGIAGYNDNTGPGIFGKSTHGQAAVFEGDITVTGAIHMDGGDLAEHFDVADGCEVEPGTVMVLDGEERLRMSQIAYDRKVVGVLAGAGRYRPGLILDHRAGVSGRQALALVGKVYCKVDASSGPVDVGDLLTTSATAGHAMKAAEPGRAFGAVLGKALAPLPYGTGLVPILVALQ
jgi:hypothetical protein